MTVSIQINVSGDDIGKRLNQISQKTNDLTPVMGEIGMAVEHLVIQGFYDGVDPYGKPWHRPPAHRWKNKSKRQLIVASDDPALAATWLPLRDTGRLIGSITHNADSNSVRIGTNTPYAYKHQLGVGYNLIGGRIIQRKFLPDLGLPDAWSNEVMKTLNNYLARVLA
jgi:phage gpG-like protein